VFNGLTMKVSRPSYWSIFSTPSSRRFTKFPFACYTITHCSHGQCLLGVFSWMNVISTLRNLDVLLVC
jgi:hypothetical protein